MQLEPLRFAIVDDDFAADTVKMKITICLGGIPREDFEACLREARAALTTAFAGLVDQEPGIDRP